MVRVLEWAALISHFYGLRFPEVLWLTSPHPPLHCHISYTSLIYVLMNLKPEHKQWLPALKRPLYMLIVILSLFLESLYKSKALL